MARKKRLTPKKKEALASMLRACAEKRKAAKVLSSVAAGSSDYHPQNETGEIETLTTQGAQRAPKRLRISGQEIDCERDGETLCVDESTMEGEMADGGIAELEEEQHLSPPISASSIESLDTASHLRNGTIPSMVWQNRQILVPVTLSGHGTEIFYVMGPIQKLLGAKKNAIVDCSHKIRLDGRSEDVVAHKTLQTWILEHSLLFTKAMLNSKTRDACILLAEFLDFRAHLGERGENLNGEDE
ncbi:hypothetical protein HDU98_007930 [Podochytrium sp. JEL0797]|nr:hypothetical protein HDU98_007930 [Podochytrium sp. JEL0797]